MPGAFPGTSALAANQAGATAIRNLRRTELRPERGPKGTQLVSGRWELELGSWSPGSEWPTAGLQGSRPWQQTARKVVEGKPGFSYRRSSQWAGLALPVLNADDERTKARGKPTLKGQGGWFCVCFSCCKQQPGVTGAQTPWGRGGLCQVQFLMQTQGQTFRPPSCCRGGAGSASPSTHQPAGTRSTVPGWPPSRRGLRRPVEQLSNVDPS